MIRYGTDGDDIIPDTEQNDVLYGYQGDDFFMVSRGNDTCYGGAGDDIFAIFPQPENGAVVHLYGGKGQDTLSAAHEPLDVYRLGHNEKLVVFDDDLIVFCKSVEHIDVIS